MKLVKYFLACAIVILVSISLLGFHFGPVGSWWSVLSTGALAVAGFGLSLWKPRR